MQETVNYYCKLIGDRFVYQPEAPPSEEYVKYVESVGSPGFKHLGRCNRRVFYKNVDVNANFNIQPFVSNNKSCESFEVTHEQCKPSFKSGYDAVQKFSKVAPTKVDKSALNFAYLFLHRMMYPYCNNSMIMLLDDVKSSMNHKTSCGVPFNMRLGKEETFYSSKSKFFSNMYWYAIVEALEAIALENPDFRVLWQSSQKYELRPKEKLRRLIASIRVFLSAPVDFVVLQNKYCLSFNNRFMTAFQNTFSKVGMTKYRRGWHNFVKSFGDQDNVISIDGVKFDTTISHVFTDIIQKFRVDCYEPFVDKTKVKKIMSFIYNNIQNSILILENGDVVIKQVGNTSGQGNTIIDNTMSSIIAFTYFYHRRCKTLEMEPTYEGCLSIFKAAILGDDVLIGIRLTDRYFVNFNILEETYREIGMELSLESSEFSKITDSEFLSTKFIQGQCGVWLPYMDRNKMFSSLMVGDPNADPRWIMLRIYAFRIECWADKPFINMLIEFENYMFSSFRNHFNGTMYVGKFNSEVTWDMIVSMRLTDNELDALYYGWESASQVERVASNLSALLNLEN